jgi:uncharacterized protein (TIGR02757 family)
VKNLNRLKTNLEKIYRSYNKKSLIPPDPLQFVYQYKNPLDKELIALIASALAYGRVQHIQNSLTTLFTALGPHAHDFVTDFTKAERKKLKNFKHRFNTGQDISDLLIILKTIYRNNSTLQDFFCSKYNPADPTIIPALSTFTKEILKMHKKILRRPPSRSFTYLLPDPANNSPCKRLNMFLRWMVRTDNIDTGLWNSIKPAALIIPMDTHLARISKFLKFHNKKNISLKTAVKVTEAFAKLNPEDPVKYDFALCRLGMQNPTGNAKIKNLLMGTE